MAYRTIDPRMWSDDKFRRLSDDGKMLFVYLVTCPHCRIGGIYLLDKLYAMADLGWSEKRLEKAFPELTISGMALYDEENRVILLPNFLKYDKAENPNQVKAIISNLESLPYSLLTDKFLGLLEQLTKPFAKPFIEQFRKRFTKPDSDSDSGTDTDTGTDTAPGANPSSSADADLPALWNRICTSLPKCEKLTEKRKTHVRARLKEHSPSAWEGIFQRIEASPFLRGENDRGWKADFDWIIKAPDNAVKVLEGKYDGGRNGTGPKGEHGQHRGDGVKAQPGKYDGLATIIDIDQ